MKEKKNYWDRYGMFFFFGWVDMGWYLKVGFEV